MKILYKALIVSVAIISFIFLLFVAISLSNNIEKKPNPLFVQGWVADAYDTGEDYEGYDIWNITLTSDYNMPPEIGNTQRCIFINNLSPPPEDVNLKLYYNPLNCCLVEIYKVESL